MSGIRPSQRTGGEVVRIALTIAGSDSGGGAGIQADLKTFAALGLYGASVITAVTAQNTLGVQAVHDVPPDIVAAQLRSVLDDLDVAAVKIGMLSRPETIEVVAAALAAKPELPVVLDPVMVATSGDRLVPADAVAALVRELLPRARLLTPNLPEAAALLGAGIARDEAQAAEQGRGLLALGPAAVLVKGGHAEGPDAIDVLVTAEGVRRFAAPRLATRHTHGTGCTLSAAIAAGLARGLGLASAIAAAKAYVTAAIAGADRLGIGHGSGPVHHFHAWWPPP